MRVSHGVPLKLFCTTLLFAATVLSATACKQRAFNDGKTASATGASQEPKQSEVFQKSVQDWSEFPSSSELNSLVQPGSSFANYATNAPSTPEMNLAGKVVVEGMKALFNTYKNKYIGQRRDDIFNATHPDPRFHDKNPYQNMQIDGKNGYMDLIRQCHSTAVGNQHYSDLQMGYYCLINWARLCYTSGVQSIVGDYQDNLLPANDAAGKNNPLRLTARKQVADKCGQPDPNDRSNWFSASPSGAPGVPAGGPTAADKAFTGLREFNDVITKGTFTVEQNGVSKTYSQLDLFKYLMLARTWAFPDAQQQRVLNEFWFQINKENGLADSVSLSKWEGDYFTSAPKECYFRPSRNSMASTTTSGGSDQTSIDNFDNYCGVDASGAKVYKNKPAPIGR